MDRKKFLHNVLTMGGVLFLPSLTIANTRQNDSLMSVLGPVQGDALGITLMHEHILADFVGTTKSKAKRYDPDIVFEKVLPYLVELKNAGCNTFVDCTPVYFGRDVKLLRRLAKASGLNILTNTGYYGALKENFLPPHAYTETAQQLAARWIKEWKEGIEGTGIHPGFIKSSSSLSDWSQAID